MTLFDNAVQLLRDWQAPDNRQERLRLEYLEHLSRHADGVLKSGPPAHLTASCMVFDASLRHVLLTLHRKGGFWVQFGGHCEPADADLAAAALREAVEESGLHTTDLALVDQPVDLDRHALPAQFGRCREHLDVAFAAIAPDGAEPVVSDESDDVAWWPLDALPDGIVADLPPRLHRAVTRVSSARSGPRGVQGQGQVGEDVGRVLQAD